MGHFSQTCTLTGAHITSGDTVLGLTVHEVRSFGTQISVMPVVIRGEYDTYGRIENIQETPGTRALEGYFSMPIKNICDYVTDMRTDAYDAYSEHSSFLAPEVLSMLKDYSVKVGDPPFMARFGFFPNSATSWLNANHPELHVEIRQDVTPSSHSAYFSLKNGNQRVGFGQIQDKRAFLMALSGVTGKAEGLREETLWKKVQMDKIRHFWIKGTAFDAFSKPIEGHKAWYGEDFYDDFDHLILGRAGFVRTKTDRHRGQADYHATHPALPGYYLKVDRQVSYEAALYDAQGKQLLKLNHGDSLLKALEAIAQVTGVSLPFDVEAERRITPLRVDIEHGIACLVESLREEPRFRMRLSGSDRHLFGGLRSEHCEWDFFEEIFQSAVVEGALTDEIEAMRYVRTNLHYFAMEPVLRPTPPQDGDFHAQLALGRYLTEDAQARLREFEDEEDIPFAQ